jgi:phenylacetate-CoA ligase
MSIAEDTYARLPVFGQNLALSAFGLKYRRQRLGPGFDQYVADFEQRERWPEDVMESYVVDRLRTLLRWSFLTVPYYRARWEDAGLEEGDLHDFCVADLGKLPVTPKEDVRRDPDALLSTSLSRRSRLLHHHTSGSTGTPTSVYLTLGNYRQFMAAREARSFRWANVSVRMPRSTIGDRPIVPRADSHGPFYRYNLVERQLYLSALHISRENIPNYVEGLNKHRPQVLTGLAHSHYLVAQMMLEEGLRLKYRPRAAVLSGEKITSHMKETMADAFGARVFEEYGSVENCVLATECQEGSLHMSPDFGILEILDDQGAAVGLGRPGRLVCTGLLNEVQPLIRYEIGDLAAWSPERCGCGRDSMPRLESIVGRALDALVMRDGRRIATDASIFSGMNGIVESQVIQETFDDFTIKVVPAAGFGLRHQEQLQKALRQRIGDVRVTVQVVNKLDRASSGKFKPVISRLAEKSIDAEEDGGSGQDATAGQDVVRH